MPAKPRVFRDPPEPGTTPPAPLLRPFVIAVAVVVVAVVFATIVVPPAGSGEDGIAVAYADGVLTVTYAPGVPANQTTLVVSTPRDSFMPADRPLVERVYGPGPFTDTVDLRARAERVYDVTLVEATPTGREYHYWTFRDICLGRMLRSP